MTRRRPRPRPEERRRKRLRRRVPQQMRAAVAAHAPTARGGTPRAVRLRSKVPWPLLVPTVLALYVAWLWRGPVLIGKALDPVSQGEPARAFLAVGVVTALPVWVGALASVVSRLNRKRRSSWTFLVLWALTFLPAWLLVPGGRTGVSDRWVGQVDAETGGLGEEAAAGFLMAVLAAFAGIAIGYLLTLLTEPRLGRDRRTRAPVRAATIAAATAGTVVVALGLGVRFQTW